MATGLEKATLCMWCEEPNYRAPLRATGPGTLTTHSGVDDGGERFTATGAGSTTTTVSAALTEATNAGYLGCIMVCRSATNAENVGVPARILAFNAGTDTLTHTPLPAATSSGDTFELADTDVRVVETVGGGGNVNVNSGLRANVTNEPDDQWNGYTLFVERNLADAQGTKTTVTDFATATGTFTTTGFTSSTVGDFWSCRKFPKLHGPPTLEFQTEDIERLAQRADCGEEQNVKGARTWTSEWTLPLKGSGTSAGDGVAATPPPELHPPLRSIFDVTQATGEDVSTGSTTSVIGVTNGTAVAQFPVGCLVMDSKGRAACVTAVDGSPNPDTITVNPPFFITPSSSNDTIYGGYSYEPKVTGHKTMTLDAYIGGKVRWIGYGGLPTFRIIDFKRNAIPKAVFGYQGNYWLDYAEDTPTPLTGSFDTVVPVSANDCYALLVASGSTTVTRLIIEEASIDYGHEIVQEDGVSLFDAIYGGRIVNTKVRVTVTGKLDTATPNNTYAEFVRYYGSRTFSLLLQHGSVPGYTVAWYGHRCEWAGPTHSVADGLRKVTFTARVLSSELTDMPKCTLGFL